MGKYIGYALLIFLAAFILNWFGIIHLSFLDVKDVTAKNQEMVYKSENEIKLLD